MREWIETHATGVVAALAVIDLVTLVVTLVIALNQGAAVDEAINRGCHNSGVLIQQAEQALQQSSPKVYRTFFPDVPRAQLKKIIDQQTAQYRAQIRELSVGCTPEQLRVTP